MDDLGNWFLQARDKLTAKGQAAVEQAINTPANPTTTNPTPIKQPNTAVTAMTKNPSMTLIVAVVVIVVLFYVFEKKVA